MKKLVYLMAMMLLPLSVFGQTYSSLWKRVADAESKDLPKTQIEWLGRIIDKAQTEKQYGHLLKAELLQAAVQTQISPDSMDASVEHITKLAESAKDPVLEAIYACALGKIYENMTDKETESKAWFDRAMKNPDLLAKQKDNAYEPALLNGIDSKVFYDDLLHVLGIESRHYGIMHDYYTKNGNRAAACLSAYFLLTSERKDFTQNAKKSKYLQSVDSLINVYGDLREAGELAIEHYNFLSQCDNITAEDRVNYINYALARWGEWPHMNVLRNALIDLQQPSFNINIGDMMLLPNAERLVRVNSIRNINELLVNVYRLNVNGDTRLDPTDDQDYAKLQRVIFPGAVQTITRRYIGQPAWKENSDSITLEGLPIGVYLVEATTDNRDIAPQRAMLRVSNLFVMTEQQPDQNLRLVVVNATTGAPVPGASIELSTSQGDGEFTKDADLKTNKNGEANYRFDKREPSYIYAYTDDDKASGVFHINGFYSYWKNDNVSEQLDLFTDRSIYRPGQQVQVSAIYYHKDNRNLKSVANAYGQVKFTLRDANGKEVATKNVSTDIYGTAAVDFTLPQQGLTGRFSIIANADKAQGYASISVEQYKRPTFQITFDPYKEAYHAGDTVQVRGIAKSFAGVPVQGAKVEYTIERRQNWWWRWVNRGESTTLLSDTTLTSDDGSFMVKVPMVFPEDMATDRPLLYNMVVNAKVTDLGGETHEGETSLPLSNRSSFLTTDIPSKQLRDSLRTFTLTRKNVLGKEIDGQVSYRFDDGEWKTAPANEPISIKQKFNSGLHQLEAICENDTLKQEFVLFAISDKHPAVHTSDWFYLSNDQFPNDGKPIYLQVGSSDEDVHVYYSIYSGNQKLEEDSRVLNNEVHTARLTYKENYGDGITINMAWVKKGILYHHSVQLKRPVPDNQLKLSWKTFRDRLTSGQKETWTLQVLSPDGKPAKAQLLSTLYDKSLNQLRPHQWTFSNDYYLSLPNTSWNGGSDEAVGLYGFQNFRPLPERDPDFTHFDESMFRFVEPRVFYTLNEAVVTNTRVRGTKMEALSVKSKSIGGIANVESAQAASDMVSNTPKPAIPNENDSQSKDVQVRENLNETAFFYPALTTDAEGNVSIRFTLPESVTTWRFMGLAHDEQINYGMINADAVAKKDVMIQPNLPRFIRMGDKAQVSARISNTSERRVNGTARLQLLNPETEAVISEWTKSFVLDKDKTTSVTFDIDADQLAVNAKGATLFIARVMTEGNGFSDGEQHYLPLLPNREYITTTVPFTQNGVGTKTINLNKLFPSATPTNKLTIEYTNQPAWLMVQALPSIANPFEKNAISLAAAIYANTLGQQLITSSPRIAQTINLWQQESGKETSLMSSLQKNEDLKSLVLSETPWVADAENETLQKQQLATFLNPSTIDYRINNFTQKLSDLQNGDGSFSWWPGMHGSTTMTMAVVEILSRLKVMSNALSQTSGMMDNAFSYLDRKIAEEVKELKRLENKGQKDLTPSEMACHYLYASALVGRKATNDANYLVNLLEKMPTELTIYGKAGAAVVLAQYGKTQRAKEYLKSINEYSVYKEEMGRYFDTRRAYYSWRNYRIPTQVATIEAMKLIGTDDRQAIEDMQRWLLQEKRTTGWDTPINAVDAVYAFLAGADGKADMSKLDSGEPSTLRLDGKPLDLPKATTGMGYVKTSVQTPNANTFSAEKTSEGTSWGALYAQFWQKNTDVESTSAGINVKREIVSATNGKATSKLHVGDKVSVRITITADRDYDFVQVQDKRAACMEPAQQLSGYHWGYYCAPQDNVTNYYFDQLAKGKHVVETDYYIDREGDYTTGICTAQCAYSPEFSGREAAKTLSVSK